MSLEDLEGNMIDLSADDQATMIFFLSPECPLCENYALNMNKIYADSTYSDFCVYGVFPGDYYSRSKIKAYKIKYEIDMLFLLDPRYELTHELKAKVTPEVFVFNPSDDLVYNGAIDNWMVSLGKKRTKVTEHYLLNALSGLKNGQSISPSKTTPVGCFIE